MKLKNVTAALIGLFLLGACTPKQKEGFTLSGKIDGISDKAIYLVDCYTPAEGTPLGLAVIDSTRISDGTFTLKGDLDHPKLVTLYLDMSGTLDYDSLYTTTFYLENSKIDLTGTLDNLLPVHIPSTVVTPPTITGSATQDKYKKYLEDRAPYTEAYKKATERYYTQAVDTTTGYVLDTKIGNTMYRDILKAEEDLRAFNTAFIAENADNIIGLNVAKDVFISNGGTDFTEQEVKEIQTLLREHWKGIEAYESFDKHLSEISNIALGQPIRDFTALDLNGKETTLKEHIAPDRYTLIDFWASWCGPCRFENPHLKEVEKKYRKYFQIVSISLDESESEWKKAVAEEELSWPQMRLPKGVNSEGAKLYSVQSIPFCLLVSPEGKIIGSDARGSKLDILLEQYLSK